MIWLGIIIGFVTGVVVVTLCYTPLVDKVKSLEQRLIRETELRIEFASAVRRYGDRAHDLEQQAIRDKALIDDSIKTLQAYETQNQFLRADLKQLQAMIPPEIYARFFDAPYKS
jgi:predicted RNase H-related nuclease YkuK (DUF458 family)